MSDNRGPLRGWFLWGIRLLWGAVILGNFIVLSFFSPEAFQRVAGLWTALLILWFAYLKRLSGELERASRGEGPLTAIFQEKMGPLIQSEDKVWHNKDTDNSGSFKSQLYTENEIQKIFFDLDRYNNSRLQPAEIALGVWLALQGAYGDYFAEAVQ